MKSAAVPVLSELKQLNLDDIVLSNDNQRGIDRDSPAMCDLANSIRENGLLQPILCRPLGVDKKYEVVAGARRMVAHRVIGLDTITALVVNMTDEEAADARVIENLQREDLTPLEEAQQIKLLLSYGRDPREIAASVGKSPSFILRRAKLCDMIPDFVTAIKDENSPFSSWSAAHLDLVARFDAKTQEKIFKQLSNNQYAVMSMTLEGLEELGGEFTHELKNAPWDVNSAGLFAKAGPCTSCQKRSSCHPGLFAEYSDDVEIRSLDRCLDAACWKKKDALWMVQREQELRDEHPALVKITTDYWGRKDVLGTQEYDPAKAKDKGAVPAVVVDGEHRGSLKYVKVKKEAKREEPAPVDPKEELKAKRLSCLRELIGQATLWLNKPPEPLAQPVGMLAAVLAFVSSSGAGTIKDYQRLMKDQRNLLITAWDEVKANISDNCGPHGPFDTPAALKALAEFLELDFKDLQRQANQTHPADDE